MIYEDDGENIFYTTPQADDGNRNALDTFMQSRDLKAAGLIAFCVKHGEYWKARVFLELLWEYEVRKKAKDEGYTLI